MSSYLRRIQRRAEKAHPDYEAKPDQVRVHEDGSFDRLHPTKGWKHTSARRSEAQNRIAMLTDTIDRRMGRDIMSRLRAAAARDPFAAVASMVGTKAA